MCTLIGYRTMTEKTLEEVYKGCQHKLSKLIQEEQGELNALSKFCSNCNIKPNCDGMSLCWDCYKKEVNECIKKYLF